MMKESNSAQGCWVTGPDGGNDVYVDYRSRVRDGNKSPNQLDAGCISMERVAQDTLSRSFPQVGKSEPENGTAAKLKVLVADDEQLIANTLVSILGVSGFEARAVYSGRAAVDALAGFEPDIFVSDVMMPAMTGIEAAIAIQALRPTCKVLLFSGQAGTVDFLTEARAQGHSFEILAKPVHPSDLLEKLRTVAIGAERHLDLLSVS